MKHRIKFVHASALYIYDLEYYQVFFPFLSNYKVINDYGISYHNELIEIFSAFGFVGFFYYYLILEKVNQFNEKYNNVSISIVLVIFLGGIAVENTFHPYSFIILAYLISFYKTISKISPLKTIK